MCYFDTGHRGSINYDVTGRMGYEEAERLDTQLVLSIACAMNEMDISTSPYAVFFQNFHLYILLRRCGNVR